MTKDERDAGDKMAELLGEAVESIRMLDKAFDVPESSWLGKASAAIQAWEKAKEDER